MSIQYIDIHIPQQLQCVVVGALYQSDDPYELGQDMLEVRLPNGKHINAGWYPEGSPNGKYRVSVYLGPQQIASNLESDDVNSAAMDVESRIWQHSPDPTIGLEVDADCTYSRLIPTGQFTT